VGDLKKQSQFSKAEMDVSGYINGIYEEKLRFRLEKTKPIKANF